LRRRGTFSTNLIWIAAREGGRSLLIRITPVDEKSLAVLEEKVGEAVKAIDSSPNVESTLVRRGEALGRGIDVEIPLSTLLGGAEKREEIETRLFAYVLPLVEAVTLNRSGRA